MSTNPPNIADLLRNARKRALLSQSELAAVSGVSLRTISDIERGLVTTPHPNTMRRLSDALDLTAVDREVAAAAVDRGVQRGPNHHHQRSSGEVVGRAAEIAAITRHLSAGRMTVQVVGPAGIGKSVVAQEAARQWAAWHGKRVVIVECHAASTGDEVIRGLARAIDLSDDEPHWRERLQHDLGDGEWVVVLDDVDRVDGLEEALNHLLDQCPGLCVVVSSRMRLSGRRFSVVVVGSLTAPTAEMIEAGDLNGVMATESVELFAARAALVNRGFHLHAGNAFTIGEIGRLLNGLPLAIELAAAQSDAYSPHALLTLLESSGMAVLSQEPGKRQRFETMAAAIGWTFDLLTQQEQQLLLALSIVPGEFDLGIAEALATAVSARDADVLAILTALDNKNFIEPLPTDDLPFGQRWRMLQAFRMFARPLLRAAGKEHTAERALVHFLADEYESIEMHVLSPEPDVWLAQFDRDRENLNWALCWVSETPGEGDVAHKLIANLGTFWQARSETSEARRWVRVISTIHPETVSTNSCWTAHWGSYFAFLQNDIPVSLKYAEEMQRLATIVEDPELRMLAMGERVRTMLATNDSGPLCAELLAEALAVAETLSPSLPVAMIHNLAGIFAQYHGELKEAERRFERTIAIREGLGALIYALSSRAHLVCVLVDQGRIEEALSTARLLLEDAFGSEDRWAIVVTLVAAASAIMAHPTLENARAALRLIDASEDLAAARRILVWKHWQERIEAVRVLIGEVLPMRELAAAKRRHEPVSNRELLALVATFVSH